MFLTDAHVAQVVRCIAEGNVSYVSHFWKGVESGSDLTPHATNDRLERTSHVNMKKTCQCDYIFCQRTACARSVKCITASLLSHHVGYDVSVSNTSAEATEQEVTLTNTLMYPFSLHDEHQSVQIIQHLPVRDEINGLQHNVFSINTPLRRGCHHRLTHRQCTMSDQSSCVSNMACSMTPAATQHPLRFHAVFFSGLVSTGHQSHTQLVFMRFADHGSSRPQVSWRALPLVHLLVQARIAHSPTVQILQA